MNRGCAGSSPSFSRKLADVCVDRPFHDDRSVECMYGGEELVSRKDAAGGLHRHSQQLELDGGEPYLPAIHKDLVPVEVLSRGAPGQLRDRSLVRARATEDGPDARHKLSGAERLRDVVVRPGLETHDLVHLLHLRGQHQNRHKRRLANPLADRDPIDLGQQQIKDDEVRAMTIEQFQRLRSVVRCDHPDPLALQVQLNEGDHLMVVVHDEDRRAVEVNGLLPTLSAIHR